MPTTTSPDPEAGASTAVRGVRRGPSALTVLGVVLLAAGLSCLGWLAYQYIGTDVVSHRAFDEQTRSLRSQWSSAAPQQPAGRSSDPTRAAADDEVPGSAIALMRIPRFGADYQVPVVAGTDLTELARGIGHYDGTAGPGEVGNFAVAGHRITHGQPFAQLLTLQKGDRVIVETRTAVFTYVLDTAPRDLTVKENASWVLDPVPDQPDVTPTQPLITLTTCQDLFHSPDRSVGFGHLESTQNK